LKGHPIEKLDPDKVKEGLNPPAEPYKAAGINPNLIKNEITACLKILTEESEKVIASEKALLAELDRLRSDEALQKELKSLTLWHKHA
jgi:hypothetical protein